MSLFTSQRLRGGLSIVALLAASTTAGAQVSTDTPSSPQEDAAANESSGGMQDIVVTATRRSATLQETALSVVAVSSEDLTRFNILEPRDLFQRVPGMVATNSADRTSSLVSARGINIQVGGAVAADLPIAFLVDDVVYPRAGDMNPVMYDVERVEVLRGPQGTLFGRNALGGAIAVINRTPTDEKSFTANFTLTDAVRASADGALNLPIGDGAAARLSYSFSKSEGLVDNQLSPNKTAADNFGAVRLQTRFELGADAMLNLSASYSSSEGRAYALRISGDRPDLFPDIATDKFTVDMPEDNVFKVDMSALIARLEWDLGPGTLTSISAHRWSGSRSVRNAIALPVANGFDINTRQRSEQFSQELRYAFDLGALSGVVGAYGLYDRATVQWDTEFNLVPGTLAGAIFGTDPKENRQFQKLKAQSYAVFGELEYELTGTLTAFAGTRATWDKKRGYTEVTGSVNPLVATDPLPIHAPFDGSWSAVTPKVGMKWQPTRDINFYALYSKGYQSGGYALSLPSLEGLSRGFDPQFADNYEIGLKGQFFDRRLRLNVTGYLMNISDLQVSISEIGASGGFQRIANVGRARSKGIEAEVDLGITDELNLSIDYAYNDARYTSYLTGTADLSGNRLPLAPKHAVLLGLAYEKTFDNDSVIGVNLDYTHRSRSQLHEANDIPAFVTRETIQDTIDARIAYTFPSGDYTLSLWGKNLTNDAVLQYLGKAGAFYYTPAEFAAGKQGFSGFYNVPREIGVSLAVRF